MNTQVLDIAQSASSLAFTLVPQDMKIQVARTWSLEILYFIVLSKFIAYFDEEIKDFHLCCGRFSPTEI